MTGTRKRQRWWLALVFAISASGLASGQNQGTFVFSSDPDSVKDPKGSFAARPNTPETRYLFVRNPKGDKAAYTVELRDGRGRAILASGKIELEKNAQGRVKLEKTPPPPAPKTTAPVPPPAAPPVPTPEPPPGIELKRDADGQFRFLLRLLDDQGKPVLDNQQKPIESRVPVELRQPFSYIDDPTMLFSRENNIRQLNVSVKAADNFSGPPAVVELVFPPQPLLRAEALRAGTYRRTIKAAGQTARLQANDLPVIEGTEEKVRFSLNVDGYARAFIYEVDFQRPASEARQGLDRKPAVRVLPLGADRPVLSIGAKPVDKYPVRVEVDNAPIGAKLSIRLDRSGAGTFSESDEVMPLESTREEHVFIDANGDEESLAVNYRVSDWVYMVDTRAMRGKHELLGVLEYEMNGKKDDVKFSCLLVLDDTPPEALEFGKLPAQHIKGTPLKLTATAREPETSIKQAIFFLGKPAEGKLPPDAPKAEGELVDAKIGLWRGELPIPDKKGMIEVSVQFVNETGQSAVKTQKIELIDPPAPAGTIEGIVELGGRGQAKLTVILRDAESKEKSIAVTNDKGEFKFENVPPGAYKLHAAKPDSGVGTKGNAAAQVIVGKTTKVNVTLERKP